MPYKHDIVLSLNFLDSWPPPTHTVTHSLGLSPKKSVFLLGCFPNNLHTFVRFLDPTVDLRIFLPSPPHGFSPCPAGKSSALHSLMFGNMVKLFQKLAMEEPSETVGPMARLHKVYSHRRVSTFIISSVFVFVAKPKNLHFNQIQFWPNSVKCKSKVAEGATT